MEDMARLALVEQNVKDIDKFSEILRELLSFINHILDNPHEKELRTIDSDVLKKVLHCQAFGDYLKYIGFETVQNGFEFPTKQALSKLRMAQAALERKISFCCGPLKSMTDNQSGIIRTPTKRQQLTPTEILTTRNEFLLKIQTLFNNMLKYEDEDLLQTAREHIPLVTLQLMALDRMREQQKKIKTGQLKGQDMSFDIALLLELLGWFKHRFFSWVDQPTCTCGGPTTFMRNSTMTTDTETCRVEVYKCARCGAECPFPRHNDARTLLRTRRGRCGEWANCFALLGRALGYDTRYVYDTTDHVWCEVFDYDSNSWLHADPCEGKLNTPLMYAHGWGKKLSYVIATSKDDLQDVTWRYTTDHKEVLARRTEVPETDLVLAILALRHHRQAQLTPARRKYLAARNLRELADLMVERKPTDYESHGRVSGSRAWRLARGEAGAGHALASGAAGAGHTFSCVVVGAVRVRYYTAADRYSAGAGLEALDGWAAGAYRAHNVFRKVENDWRQAYLAREDGDEPGAISWRLAAAPGLAFDRLAVRTTATVYGSGAVAWTVRFDDEEPVAVDTGSCSYSRVFRSVTLSAELSGGQGEVGWQHAQIFRQALDDDNCTLDIQARLVSNQTEAPNEGNIP